MRDYIQMNFYLQREGSYDLEQIPLIKKSMSFGNN